MVANDPQKEAYAERIEKGIPITETDLNDFRELLDSLQMDQIKYPFLFKE